MATIRQEMILRTDPAKVWDAVRDVGAIHTRLAPDFVRNVEMAGDARIVTFANGRIVREEIVTLDDAARRLVWSAVGTQMTHHNGSIQVFPKTAAAASSGSPTSSRTHYRITSAG
jgi:hypothetical protein